MFNFFVSLFAWLPPVLQTVCACVVMIFFLVTILHIVRFVLDLIPFV